MSASTRSRARLARRRAPRVAAATSLIGLAWFALAGTASSVDPSASASPSSATAAGPSPEVTAAPSPAPTDALGSPAPTAGSASATPAWTPDFSPSASESLNPLFIPTMPPATPLPATAPPLPTPIPHPTSGDKNGCYDCHSAVNDKQAGIARDWKSSAHASVGVTCADCHGGDPTSDQITVAMDPKRGFVGTPTRLKTVGLCGSCHADPARMKPYNLETDQYEKYWTSVHGQQLLVNNDVRVAICVDCHGVHDIKKTTDPTAKVFPLNVPALCSSCHSDAARMQPYGIPTNQYQIYSRSVHGVALLQDKDTRAPSCASCHGSHDAQPPTSATVVEVCGKCHTATQKLYEESRHSQLPAATPQCWTCHGWHDVSQPSSERFFHQQAPNYTCVTCHDLQSHKLRLEVARFGDDADRRCDTCHHPDSDIYAQAEGINKAVTGAEAAYRLADDEIQQAARLGMITSDAEVVLAGAKTSLIQAQAAVHTTKLATISQLATDAIAKAREAQARAEAKIEQSNFRREAMTVVLALIGVCVVFLVLLKRQLDREAERG